MTFYDGQSEEIELEKSFLHYHQLSEPSNSLSLTLKKRMQEEERDPHDNQSHVSRKQETLQKPSPDPGLLLSKKVSPILIKKRYPRKVRSTITKELLIKLNEQLKVYHDQYMIKRTKDITLKEIAKKLGLGYRTILAKNKEFRSKKEVKGGLLLQAEPRCYKKSLDLVKIITTSLNNRKFKKTTQLCKYIKLRYNIAYTRTQISYYKTKIRFNDLFFCKTSIEHEKMGEKALLFYEKLILNSEEELIYYSEGDYQSLDGESLRVLILCSKRSIQTYVLPSTNEHQIKETFLSLLTSYLLKCNYVQNSWFLVCNVKDLYQRFEQNDNQRSERFNFEERLLELKGKLFCLPLGYERYNPAYFYCQLSKMTNKWINVPTMHLQNIENQLVFYKKTFTSTFPILLHSISSKLFSIQQNNPDL